MNLPQCAGLTEPFFTGSSLLGRNHFSQVTIGPKTLSSPRS
jgi:hypothetical protein